MVKNGRVKLKVLLTLNTEKEGGRRTPIESGFRTDVSFSENESRFAAFEFSGGLIYPGDTKETICHVLLHSEQEIDSILSRKSLSVVEGTIEIGSIVVESVIDRESVQWAE